MKQMILNKNSNAWLILRTLTPSPASLAGGFVAAVGLIGLHLFLLSNNQSNLVLPHLTGLANDQLAEVYRQSVQQRLDQTFGNSTFSFASTAVIWGFAGWLFFTVSDFIISNLKELQSADEHVNMPLKNQVVSHPLKSQFVIRLLWRVLTGVLIIVATLVFSPYISELFRQDVLLISSSSLVQMAKCLGISLGGWMIIIHVYVVLLRFFVMRTRVFGEILY